MSTQFIPPQYLTPLSYLCLLLPLPKDQSWAQHLQSHTAQGRKEGCIFRLKCISPHGLQMALFLISSQGEPFLSYLQKSRMTKTGPLVWYFVTVDLWHLSRKPDAYIRHQSKFTNNTMCPWLKEKVPHNQSTLALAAVGIEPCTASVFHHVEVFASPLPLDATSNVTKVLKEGMSPHLQCPPRVVPHIS